MDFDDDVLICVSIALDPKNIVPAMFFTMRHRIYISLQLIKNIRAAAANFIYDFPQSQSARTAGSYDGMGMSDSATYFIAMRVAEPEGLPRTRVVR